MHHSAKTHGNGNASRKSEALMWCMPGVLIRCFTYLAAKHHSIPHAEVCAGATNHAILPFLLYLYTLKRSDVSTPTFVLKAALHGLHRDKAALAEQALQKSLELQQGKAASDVSAEASDASQQVFLHTKQSLQHMLNH